MVGGRGIAVEGGVRPTFDDPPACVRPTRCRQAKGRCAQTLNGSRPRRLTLEHEDQVGSGDGAEPVRDHLQPNNAEASRSDPSDNNPLNARMRVPSRH